MFRVTALEPVTDINAGLEIIDIVLIQAHVLGIEAFSSVYQLLAADYNRDEEIKASDILAFQAIITGRLDSFTNNNNWIMLDAAIPEEELVDPAERLNYRDIFLEQEGGTGIDFVGIKRGDLDNSIDFVLQDSVRILEDTLHLQYVDRDVLLGETLTIDFTSANYEDMYGIQFTLEHPTMMFHSVMDGALEVGGAIGLFEHKTSFAIGNVFTNSTEADEVLFTLELTALSDGKLSELLGISSSTTKATAYRKTDASIANAKQMAVYLGAKQTTATNEIATTAKWNTVQNHPNPAATETTISFELDYGQEVVIHIYNTQGKLMLNDTMQGKAGSNRYSIDLGSAYAPGVYLYAVLCREYQVTKHLTIVR